MNRVFGTASLAAVVFLTAGAVLLTARGGGSVSAAGSAAPRASGGGGDDPSVRIAPLRDETLAPRRAELLDLAFDSATAIPVQPHIKTRCRTQDSVVATCLELEQPARALRFIERIQNWRRGTGYADLAYYLVQHGDTSRVADLLALARKVCEEEDRIEFTQAWRKDRIRAKIARVQIWLGQEDEAAVTAAGLTDSEAVVVVVANAEQTESSAFEDRIAALEKFGATGSFDQVQGALQACVRLFDRFYENDDRRARAEALIRSHGRSLPLQIRIELAMDLARASLSHGDAGSALRLVGEGRAQMEGVAWTPEHRIPLQAKLGALRFRAGEEASGRGEVDEAKALFEASREEIVDIYRAGTLRPLAESYLAMEDREAAAEVYRTAVEEGVRNPNLRPRAEDLAATCCSMALHGFEPDEPLRRRLLEIRDGLGNPR